MISPSYEDREQTAVKHKILTRYLSALIPIVGAWASDITYIDCLAGPWKSVDPEFKDTSFGQAIDVLRSTREVLKNRGKFPTLRCLFIENDPIAFNRLKEYCDGITDIEVSAENWDLTKHVQDVVRFAQKRDKSFPFVFIDPTGWEQLEIELIRPILALTPGEVLINLMTSWITRFISDESKHLERLFGADLQRLATLKGEEQEAEVVNTYANMVRSAGHFEYVCTLPVLKPNQDAFHFYMIYGTRHMRGVEVFKETEKSVIPFMHETRAEAQQRRRFLQSGQASMLTPEAHYREARFTRHQIRSLGVARRELEKKLQSSGKLRYEDAWAIAMQHSAVMNSDLQEWLTEWKANGHLEITNQQPGQKLARKGQGQYLKWKQES